MLQRTADQELLAETSRRFIEAECPLSALRMLGESRHGYEPTTWQQGAQLGWTSLLVSEDAGGGSISENAASDLLLVAYEFGLHATPGPLLPSNVVAAALDRWGSVEQKSDPLPGILSGETVASWALAEPPPHDGFGAVETTAARDGEEYVLHGVKLPVEAGSEASHFLVTAREGIGLTQFLVPRDAPGLDVAPLEALDMTRRFARVELAGVRLDESAVVGQPKEAGPAVAWLSDLAVAIQLAEMVGAMQWSFDTTLDWSFNRFSFGRPLASYQEIKHRFADMKMWLEASHAIADAAGDAMAADAYSDQASKRSETVSAGKFYVGHYGGKLVQDCVQLHGGIGVTFDHDLHIFLRRLTTDTALFGTPAQHAARLTALLEGEETQS